MPANETAEFAALLDSIMVDVAADVAACEARNATRRRAVAAAKAREADAAERNAALLAADPYAFDTGR